MKLSAATYSAEAAASAAKAGYFLRFFTADCTGRDFGLGVGFPSETAGRDLAFAGIPFFAGAPFIGVGGACLSFGEAGFTGAVFLPCPPDPPFTGFPSAS